MSNQSNVQPAPLWERVFILSPKLTGAPLAARLARVDGWQAAPQQHLQRLFFDSTDWRLYRLGTTLEGERDARGDGAWRLSWRCLKTGKVLARCPLDTPPPHAALPAGPLRDRLDDALKARPLLAQVELRTVRHIVNRLNKDNKTLLRLHIDHNTPAGTGVQNTPRAAFNRLWLEPVQGYQGIARRALLSVAAELRQTPGRDDLLEAALAAAGQPPPGNDAVTFDASTPAGDAVKQLLRQQLRALDANLPGVRAGLDSQYLHDYRVAVRRTRSALIQLKTALPAALLKRFKPAFARLGQISSPARDFDVLLLALDDYAAPLAASPRAALSPLYDELRRRQRQARQQLLKHLSSAGHRRVLSDWRRALETPWKLQTTDVKALADARIRRAYRRVLRDGRNIDAATPLDALHELRKTCKKLRYLLEFFQPLYARKKITARIKQLKKLQNHLGQLQDLDVHAAALRDAAAALTRDHDTTADALLAAGALIADIERRRQRIRDAFETRFNAFDTAPERARFAALFG